MHLRYLPSSLFSCASTDVIDPKQRSIFVFVVVMMFVTLAVGVLRCKTVRTSSSVRLVASRVASRWFPQGGTISYRSSWFIHFSFLHRRTFPQPTTTIVITLLFTALQRRQLRYEVQLATSSVTVHITTSDINSFRSQVSGPRCKWLGVLLRSRWRNQTVMKMTWQAQGHGQGQARQRARWRRTKHPPKQ